MNVCVLSQQEIFISNWKGKQTKINRGYQVAIFEMFNIILMFNLLSENYAQWVVKLIQNLIILTT